MSFYLLPPVSYQTQQKLKKDIERKKELKKQRHKARKHSTESTTSSIRSPSSKSVRSNSIFNKSSYAQSIDELSNLDSLSITSEKSEKDQVKKEKTKEKERKKSHTFNYSYNTDLNEIVSFSKSHRPSDRRKGSYTSSSYTPSQYASSNYAPSQYDPMSVYSSSIYSDDDSILQGLQSRNAANVSNVVNPNYKLEFKDTQEHKTSLEFQLSEDEEEENALTRVYSDVDSIFSTKAETSPKSRIRIFGN